mmetsp:Transcript_3056/g.5814  ORF Transcript_3056/g.5814 Transcript_3056/m.5814 type:complete len:504 (+) Transcript_3056:455-1966(+)
MAAEENSDAIDAMNLASKHGSVERKHQSWASGDLMTADPRMARVLSSASTGHALRFSAKRSAGDGTASVERSPRDLVLGAILMICMHLNGRDISEELGKPAYAAVQPNADRNIPIAFLARAMDPQSGVPRLQSEPVELLIHALEHLCLEHEPIPATIRDELLAWGGKSKDEKAATENSESILDKVNPVGARDAVRSFLLMLSQVNAPELSSATFWAGRVLLLHQYRSEPLDSEPKAFEAQRTVQLMLAELLPNSGLGPLKNGVHNDTVTANVIPTTSLSAIPSEQLQVPQQLPGTSQRAHLPNVVRNVIDEMKGDSKPSGLVAKKRPGYRKFLDNIKTKITGSNKSKGAASEVLQPQTALEVTSSPPRSASLPRVDWATAESSPPVPVNELAARFGRPPPPPPPLAPPRSPVLQSHDRNSGSPSKSSEDHGTTCDVGPGSVASSDALNTSSAEQARSRSPSKSQDRASVSRAHSMKHVVSQDNTTGGRWNSSETLSTSDYDLL